MNAVAEIKPQELQVMAAPSPMQLMQIALQGNAPIETLERLMDLQDRANKSEAKRQYDQAFSAFKAEAVSVRKGADTKNGPLQGRKYAELDDWVTAVTPALSKHGLSSSWKLTKDEKDWIEVTCYLRHIGGHEESVSMGGPPDDGAAKNKIQARASTVSYLERYTLKAITGLSEKGDDPDGNPEKTKKTSAPAQITDAGFKRALAAVKAGTYTVAQVLASNTVTADQETALRDAEKERAK